MNGSSGLGGGARSRKNEPVRPCLRQPATAIGTRKETSLLCYLSREAVLKRHRSAARLPVVMLGQSRRRRSGKAIRASPEHVGRPRPGKANAWPKRRTVRRARSDRRG